MKYTILTFFVLLFLLPAQAFATPTGDAPEEDYKTVDWFLYGGYVSIAVELLDEIIEKYPRPLEAMQLRSQFTWANGQGEQALELTARALKLFPRDTGFLLLNCMVRESMDEPKGQSLQCYRDAVSLMKKSHPAHELRKDSSYTLALILAESPEAGQAIEDFVQTYDEPTRSLERKRLRNYDRSELKRNYEGAKQRAKDGTPLF